MSYFEKYLKYKSKYLRLKQLLNNETQIGGGKRDILQIDALSDTPTNLEAFGYDIGDFPNLPNYYGGSNGEGEKEKDEKEGKKEKKEIMIDSDMNLESSVEDSEKSEDSEESEDSEKSEDSEESEDSEIETDSVLSTTDENESQEGGGYFGNLMDELSSSVKSFDLQKGGYDDDDELSPLSEDDTMKLN